MFRFKLIMMLVTLVTSLTLFAEDTIRPGDILRIDMAGESDFEKPFTVNRNSEIVLPEVGTVSVASMTLLQATEKMTQILAEHYRNLENFNLIIVERKIPVTVLGYVNNPGHFNLPADGNIQMALSLAEGATAGAQMDKLQVRNGDKFIEFDYKKYLDSGDTSLLPPLEPLDVIFVPSSPLIGNVQMEFDAATLSSGGDANDSKSAIKIFGEVINPGSFSFNKEQDIVDYLMRAGGVTRYAGVETIRVINNNEPFNFNLKTYLDTGDRSSLPALTEKTTIFVPVEEEGVKSGARTVYVMGEVYHPGSYEAQKNSEFFDIIANAGGPTRWAESRQIRIIRADGKVDKFDLQGYTEGVLDIQIPEIFPGDAIFVPEKTDLNEKSWLKIGPDRAIRVIGAVMKPGRYEWSDEMSFLDILAHAGGPTKDADLTNLRIVVDGQKHDGEVFNLEQFINHGGSFDELPKVAAQHTIIVSERTEDVIDNKARWLKQPQSSSIYVFGQVGKPGRYAFDNTLNFLDILSAADGPSLQADIHKIKITHRTGTEARVSTVDLGLYFETGDESLLPVVKVGDTIYIPEKDKPWLDQPNNQTVRVLGAVANPGRYQYNTEMTLLDLLAEAGGSKDNAYLSEIVVVNKQQTGTDHDRSTSFNLEEFMQQPDFKRLPMIRAGDTLYVPDVTKSDWNIFMDGVSDIFTIVSVGKGPGG